MIVLLILMLLLLAPALWAYIYIWRGLNRRVIAAVKVVDPIITLGPYAMGAWAALSACVAVNIWCEGSARLIGNIITLTIAVGCALWAGFWLLMHCLGGQTPGKRPTWWREAVAAAQCEEIWRWGLAHRVVVGGHYVRLRQADAQREREIFEARAGMARRR